MRLLPAAALACILRPALAFYSSPRCYTALRRRPLVRSRSMMSSSLAEGEQQDKEPAYPAVLAAKPSGEPAPGSVYFIATPLGNLDDITVRAMRILGEADVVACEDTRVTGRLLQLLGVQRSGQLSSYYAQNAKQKGPALIKLAQDGKSIAVVSDAGTPGISDPGQDLARDCANLGIPVIPIPGPCAAVAAMSVCGFHGNEWVFFGFVPSRRGGARTKKLQEVAQERRSCVLYEAPHRIVDTLSELCEIQPGAGDRSVSSLSSSYLWLSSPCCLPRPYQTPSCCCSCRSALCARELTKLHEELFRGTVAEARDYFSGATSGQEGGKVRGEFTVVLGPVEEVVLTMEQQMPMVIEKLREMRQEGMSTSYAAKVVAKELGLKKSDVYALALEQQKQ
ncbi:unnamed protein product [Chrysoparadoxa australica]